MANPNNMLTEEEECLDEVVAPAPDETPETKDDLNSVPTGEKVGHDGPMAPAPGENSQMKDKPSSVFSKEEGGLDELVAPAPDENPEEGRIYRHTSLESARRGSTPGEDGYPTDHSTATSKWLLQLYIVSYLVVFSILGVLARIGLSALTIYPGALIANTDLWCNFGGCLIIGMLREDRLIFRRHRRLESDNLRRAAPNSSDETDATRMQKTASDTANKRFATAKAGLPVYIGLTVGFCGSFTSFASICRDAFFAISNNLDTAANSTLETTSYSRSRSAGDSVMAVMAVLILELGLSIVALKTGAHLAAILARPADKVPAWNVSRILNPLVVFLGPGCWLAAVLLTIWPVHDAWRGQVLFALVFAPAGCILRFLISVRMNKLVRSFPIGTFIANIVGTCVLGLAYDVQRSSAGAEVISCQVLQGIMDGFCGALTTVSTWILELDTLRLKHAYLYGVCSLFVGVGSITAIMGPVRWTSGFNTATCKM